MGTIKTAVVVWEALCGLLLLMALWQKYRHDVQAYEERLDDYSWVCWHERIEQDETDDFGPT